MEQVIEYLLTSPIGQYVMVLCLACRAFKIVAPVPLTEKMPDWSMAIISVLALSSFKKVDNKGNPL